MRILDRLMMPGLFLLLVAFSVVYIGGVACEAYEVQPIELELFARRKTK